MEKEKKYRKRNNWKKESFTQGEEKKMELWVIGQSDTHSLQAKNKKVMMMILMMVTVTIIFIRADETYL